MPNNLRIDPKNYFYGGQLRKYIIQFGAIFSEMLVSVGKNDFNSETNLIRVPIKYGSMDRVVAHIKTSHTQNKSPRVPMFSMNLSAIEMAPDARKGVGTIERHTRVPLGGTLSDDAQVPYKYMPIPYWLRFEVASFASNTDQNFQIVEQIMMLFDPMLQFQLSDAQNDWTKINTVELIDFNFEENYPAETQARLITNTFTFKVLCYLSPPVNIKNNYIKSIKIKLETLSSNADLNEYIESAGDLPNDDEYDTLFDIEDYDIPDI